MKKVSMSMPLVCLLGYYEQVYKGCTWIKTIMQSTNFKEPLWHKVTHIIWIPIVFSNSWSVFSGSRFFRDDTRLRALRFLDHMLVCALHLGSVWIVLGILNYSSFMIPMFGWSFGKESRILRNGDSLHPLPYSMGGGKLRDSQESFPILSIFDKLAPIFSK